MEQRLLDIRLQMEALITERAGMIAENQFRVFCGHQIAYSEDQFQIISANFQRLLEILRS